MHLFVYVFIYFFKKGRQTKGKEDKKGERRKDKNGVDKKEGRKQV